LGDYLEAGSKGAVSTKGIEKIGNQLLTKDNVDDPANAKYI